MLAALRPRKPFDADPSTFDRVLAAVPLSARIAIGILVIAVALYFAIRGLRRIGPRGRRIILLIGTAFCFVAFTAFSIWSLRLPDLKGSFFVLWHQLVRAGGALSGTLFVLGSMALLLPKVLDLIEGSGFVSYTAARHIRAGKSGFLTIISVLSIAGVAVSVLALCGVISIMGGFGADLKRKILGNNAHIRVDTADIGGFDRWQDTIQSVRLVKGVTAATPVAGGEAMASSSSNTAGVLVRGVEMDSIASVIDLIQNIEVGKLEWLKDPIALTKLPPETPIGIGPTGEYFLKGPDIDIKSLSGIDPDVEDAIVPENAYPGVVVGRELAKTLHLYVGDEVTFVAPLGDLGPMGVMPRSRTFRVAGIFFSGMYEYDSSHAYIDLPIAQEFLGLEHRVTALDVRVDDAERVEPVTAAVSAALEREDLRARDWKELNKNLFSALELEKIMAFVILALAIVVASFCIICTLMLMVTEKSKEIAILKALGAADASILRIFMTEGVIIGSIGTMFGIVTGLAACLGMKHLGVRLDPDVYYVDRLPIHVDALEYVLVAVCSILITTLATLYPAFAASRLRPVDGIRYE